MEEKEGGEEQDKGEEEEEEENKGEEKENEGRRNESEDTTVADPLTQGKEMEEIDLNETARKKRLMMDDEFQSFLDGVNKMEIDTEEMAEGLDLTSQSVEGVENEQTEKCIIHQSVREMEEEQTEEDATHQSTDEVEEKQVEEERPKPLTPSQKQREVMNQQTSKRPKYNPRNRSKPYHQCQS